MVPEANTPQPGPGAGLEVRVISLPHSHDRRAHASRLLDDLGVPFRFFDAIHGDDGAQFAARDDARFLSITGRLPVAGEYGCYASHLALWRECAATGRAMVVMEDDIRPLAGFVEALDVAGRIIDRVGYLRLEVERRARRRRVGSLGGFEIWRYTKASQGALCYVLSPVAAARLAAASAMFAMPVDVMIRRFWQHRQVLFGLTPYVATGHEVGHASTIGTRRKAARSLAERAARTVERARGLAARTAFNLRTADPVTLPGRVVQRRV